MPGIIASTIHIPDLAEAAIARGLSLLPMATPGIEADAAVVGWNPVESDAATRVAVARAEGWRGPLLLVLANGCGATVARALDAGADDAVIQPVSAGEIAARIAARLRPVAPIVTGELTIDPVARRVMRSGREIALLPREYALLLHLVRAGGRCVDRTELLAQVWGLRFDPGTNVIEVHISRLRAKLDHGFATPLLVTEKGRGYRLAV